MLANCFIYNRRQVYSLVNNRVVRFFAIHFSHTHSQKQQQKQNNIKYSTLNLESVDMHICILSL